MKLEKEIERGKSIYKGNSSNAHIGTCTCYVLHLVREVGARGSSLALSWHSYGSIYLSMVVVMMPLPIMTSLIYHTSLNFRGPWILPCNWNSDYLIIVSDKSIMQLSRMVSHMVSRKGWKEEKQLTFLILLDFVQLLKIGIGLGLSKKKKKINIDHGVRICSGMYEHWLFFM